MLRLGEEDWRIHNVGALTLDTILSSELRTRKDLSNEYNFELGKFVLIAYHPVSTEWEEAESQIRLVLDSVVHVATESNLQIVIIYPNNYPGGTRIVEVTESYSDRAFIHIFKNLPHIDYISLMKLCEVYVGNSSSGLIEAPSLGVPYVCIGTRQLGRERANNVIDVDYDKEKITTAIRKSLDDTEFLKIVAKCDSPYGDGKASKQIIEVLKLTKFDDQLLKKKMTY
jgi:UDP-hydrolysing UDP-N-acetyl-D-glucosamine 2-epimerase